MNLFRFDNSYSKLNEVFFAETAPEIPPNPELLLLNAPLAQELDLNTSEYSNVDIASLLSGKQLPAGALPLAMAYAGHQFGHFTMLGDGRAILLGEHLNIAQKRFDIQLKGSGKTPFSRGGDGLATLRAMLREYIMSECMYTLGVPTSRSLAVVKTGKMVHRETIHDGAVLTRIMDSHIRVGTFEYARQFLDISAQKELLNYSINRHFPEIEKQENQALEFFKLVCHKQRNLMIHWMRIGFTHGVMNTDNMHVGGQTFDYGPCAFMNHYKPKTVFSSIDRHGRYAYANQPEIALWNLSILGGTLLPQIHQDQEKAVELARAVLNRFSKEYRDDSQAMMCAKLGFQKPNPEATNLVNRLLKWMEENQADFTNTFLCLSGDLAEDAIPINDEFKHWKTDWQKTLLESADWESVKFRMNQMNPKVIPRNERVELALDAAVYQNDYQLLQELIEVVKNPNHEKSMFYQTSSIDFDRSYQTYCGT